MSVHEDEAQCETAEFHIRTLLDAHNRCVEKLEAERDKVDIICRALVKLTNDRDAERAKVAKLEEEILWFKRYISELGERVDIS